MNTEVLWILVIIAIVGIFGYAFYWKKKVKPVQDAVERGNQVVAQLPVTLPKTFGHNYTTPLGAVIESVAPVSAKALIAIDAGISNLLAATNARYPHWQKYRAHSDFLLWFLEPDAQNADKSPALMVRLKDSKGNVLQEVQSAGTVIGLFDRYPVLAMVLPHQAASDWAYLDYLMRSVWNEGEHYRDKNDMAVAIQYSNDAEIPHPHTPLPAGVEEVPADSTAPRGFIGNKSAVKSLPACAMKQIAAFYNARN